MGSGGPRCPGRACAGRLGGLGRCRPCTLAGTDGHRRADSDANRDPPCDAGPKPPPTATATRTPTRTPRPLRPITKIGSEASGGTNVALGRPRVIKLRNVSREDVAVCGRDHIAGAGQPGWKLTTDGEQFLWELETYDILLRQFPHVVGATVFTIDRNWDSFDLYDIWPRVVLRYALTPTPQPAGQ